MRALKSAYAILLIFEEQSGEILLSLPLVALPAVFKYGHHTRSFIRETSTLLLLQP